MKQKPNRSAHFKAKPEVIYQAWLSSQGHSQMTGAEAKCSNKVGGKFTAWDGYISGKNIQLNENKLIVQTWRTSEFSDTDEDSELSISFTETKEGCELNLVHTNIPQGQTQ